MGLFVLFPILLLGIVFGLIIVYSDFYAAAKEEKLENPGWVAAQGTFWIVVLGVLICVIAGVF